MPGSNSFGAASVTGAARRATSPTPGFLLFDTAMPAAVEALCENFPLTRAIVGSRPFEELAILHARSISPGPLGAADCGCNFPAWLEGEGIAHRRPYIVEIARCEGLRSEARGALDVPILDLGALEGIEPVQRQRLRLKLHPATRFAWLSAPALEIWQAHSNEFTEDNTSGRQPGGILFARCCQSREGARINAAEHRLLCGVRFGETLGKAIRAAEALYPNCDTGSCLTDIVQRGALAATNVCGRSVGQATHH